MPFTDKLGSQSHFLSAKECAEAFGYFDADGSGLLSADEMQKAMNIMTAPLECEIPAKDYTASAFRDLAETFSRTMPMLNVTDNLMKFIKEKRAESGKPEVKEADEKESLSKDEVAKLFAAYDKDGSNELSILELMGIMSLLELPFELIMADSRAQDGSVTLDELVGLLNTWNEQRADLNVEDKVIDFLSSLPGGKPDVPKVDPKVDPSEAVEKQDPPVGRKAVIVGINYTGTSIPALSGCINDAQNQKKMLIEHFGFKEDEIKVITDDEDVKPTCANIKAGLEWLLEGASKGDFRVFTYSGHGSQLPCTDGSEPDGQTEILCPLDIQEDWYSKSVFDDYLYETFMKKMPDGVRVLTIYDCCHSGTMSDLSCTRGGLQSVALQIKPRFLQPPPELEEKVKEKEEEAKKKKGGLFSRLSGFSAAPKKKKAPKEVEEITTRSLGPPKTPKLIWSISGCQDNQTSADAFLDGMHQGALTWGLMHALEEGGVGKGPYSIQYGRLLETLRSKLKSKGFEQKPGMSTTSDNLWDRYYMDNDPK